MPWLNCSGWTFSEIHGERRGESAVARPAAAELRLHAIEAPAPIPVIVPLAEHGASMCVAFVRPELPVDVPNPLELAGPRFTSVHVHMEPGRHGAVDVEVIGLGGIASVNLGRLRRGKAQDGVGFDRKGLDVRARVVPGELQVAG